MIFWGAFLLSFICVAFGQNSWISSLGIVAGSCGYALFWRSMLFLSKAKNRFSLAFVWFFLVHIVQLSWMTSTKYMGPGIYLVYIILNFGIAVQFGILSLFVKQPMNLRRAFGIAGMWVILEYIRLYFLSGFTWNPAGLALANSAYSIQLAAVLGIYGLSFWVILVNVIALMKKPILWAAMAAFPYLFGLFHLAIADRTHSTSKNISVALVQTALLPEQRDYWKSRPEAFVYPLDQWKRVVDLIGNSRKLDLIVLPEAVFPFGAYRNFYPIDLVKGFWVQAFGESALDELPSSGAPFGQRDAVNNLFLAQGLANHYRAHLILGLDAIDSSSHSKHNAAFHFQPDGPSFKRYDKRILVPVGEYTPFKNWKWLSEILSREFGIGDSFDRGKEATLFEGPVPIGVTICLEEMYTDLPRELRKMGAELFVNISNDVWFPDSRLAHQHFDHGRIRAVENGVCLLRSGNTGVTAGVDCFGRLIQSLPVSDSVAGSLIFSLPIQNHQTLYSWWGDWAILAVSFASILLLIRKNQLL